jgi:putative peptidoglycan lipid II flippase
MPAWTYELLHVRRGYMDEADKPSGGVMKAAGIVSLCTLLSRVLGLVRDIMCAGLFGTSWVWDAFIIAFIIPNMFRRLFGEGALASAFMPVFAEKLYNRTKAEAFRFMSAVITLLAVFLGAIALLGILATFLVPPIAAHFGVDSPKLDLTCRLLRIMLPYLPLICLVALVTTILNAFKHFTMPALASVVLNICWIAGFAISPMFGVQLDSRVIGIAWAIMIAGVLELILQLPPLFTNKVVYKPNFSLAEPGVKEVLKLMAPTVIGLSILQLNLLVDNMVAEFCVPGEGAVASLYFGNRLMQFPLAMIGIALAQAAFPYFADYAARNDMTSLRKGLEDALRLCFFISFPASVGLMLVSLQVIQMFFQWGGFNASSTERTLAVLVCYSAGIWSYCCLQVITRAFYAIKDMKTPVSVGIRTVVLNFILNITLVWVLREAGIALATAVCSIVNLIFLMVFIERRLGKFDAGRLALQMSKTVLATGVMAVCCYGAIRWAPAVCETLRLGAAAHWLGGVPLVGRLGELRTTVLLNRVVMLTLPIAAGTVSFIVAAWLLRCHEMSELVEKLRAKLRKRSGARVAD